MNTSDPIADMLTRIRNASAARHRELTLPSSRVKREIARILTVQHDRNSQKQKVS